MGSGRRTCARASASWRCSASGLRRLWTLAVFLMPSARLPKRSDDSVSAALSAHGEQLMMSIVRALPPCIISRQMAVKQRCRPASSSAGRLSPQHSRFQHPPHTSEP